MRRRVMMLIMAASIGSLLLSGCGSSKESEETVQTEEAVQAEEAAQDEETAQNEETSETEELEASGDEEDLFSEEKISNQEIEEDFKELKSDTESLMEDLDSIKFEEIFDDEADSAAVEDCVVKISIKNYGDIEVELDAEAAPVTVENFVSLVKDGFYDGLTFHRIIDGFMIQGGDPLGNGMGGSEETIIGEFSANGIENPISHERGAISMARSQDMNSASSQFFIVHEDATYLDGQYAAFGHVTKGMEVVDKICKDAKPTDNNGTIPADAQPVIESITIVEE